MMLWPRAGAGQGAVMDWARILAYVTGTVDQELLARNEYLAAENRIMSQVQGRCREGEHGRQIRTDHPSETDAGGGTNCQPAGRRYRGGARRPAAGETFSEDWLCHVSFVAPPTP